MDDKLLSHFKKYIDRPERDSSSLLMDMIDFSCLDNKYRDELMSKARFDSVDQYPPCTKYSYPDELFFKDPGDMNLNLKMAPFDVGLDQLISLDEEHFLSLHPVRYDKIKEEVSTGHIIMPYVQMELGVPTVTSGRHRVIALKTLGLSTLPISIPESEVEQIGKFLDLGGVKAAYPVASRIIETVNNSV